MFTMGIVGLGPFGRLIVGSVQGVSENVRFKTAVTRTPSKVEEFAAEKGLALGDDLAAMLQDDDIDGVVIASPAHAHVEQALAAIDAGKHVQVIKPLALTKADAERLYEAAGAKGVALCVSYERCFLPAADEFRRRVLSGALGQIVHVEGAYCVHRYLLMTREHWKTDITAAPPGALADHMLYMMIELVGPVEELHATGLHLATDLSAADTSTVTLRLAGGVSGLLTAIGVTAGYARLHFFGTKGSLEWRGAGQLIYTPVEGAPEIIEFPVVDALKEQTESFAAAAEGRGTYRISPENAIAGVAAVEAMGISAENGEAVRL
jgi:predicted dehydrogenase